MIQASWTRLRRRLLRIAESEVSFEVRGFHTSSPAAREQLERIGLSFLQGYHAALDIADIHELGLALDECEPQWRGFAFEGAAMAIRLVDALSFPRNRRWTAFLSGPAGAHVYVAHVGYGWAMARRPWTRWTGYAELNRLDSLLKWLALDGYGFHAGYFQPQTWASPSGKRPALPGYMSRAFDQGLGRSLWFVNGGDVARIVATMPRFPADRRADLWSGLGIACCYAGNPTTSEIEYMLNVAGPDAAHFCQGVAFGAEARARGSILTVNAERVCQATWGISATEAAQLAIEAKSQLPTPTNDEHYELWRSLVRRYAEEARCLSRS